MKTFGPLYVGTVKYYKNKGIPRFEIGTTQESDHPYRKGKCLIYRNSKSFTGRYLGLWVHNPRIGVEDAEEIDKLLFDALSQYLNPNIPSTYETFYRVKSTMLNSFYLVFAVKADTTLYVPEAYQFWWNEYFKEPKYWSKLFASRCEEHEIAALLPLDSRKCQGWHLETFSDLEHRYEPVF